VGCTLDGSSGDATRWPQLSHLLRPATGAISGAEMRGAPLERGL